MDKTQLIKKEIERQIEEGKVKCQQSKENNDHESLVAWSEHVATCGKLLVFINSLPEEPESEDLEEEIENYIKDSLAIKFPTTDKEQIKADIRYIARHFAEWQKEKDYKMYAHMSLKDIHDAWQELKKNKPDIEKYPAICFQKGTDWRENQMKEALQTEYEKGRFDMREEMMKDAVEDCSVVFLSDNKNWLQIPGANLVKALESFKQGDKVKIIIIKEE